MCFLHQEQSMTWSRVTAVITPSNQLTCQYPRLSYGVIITLLVAIFTPITKTIADGFENQFVKVILTALPVLIGVHGELVVSR